MTSQPQSPSPPSSTADGRSAGLFVMAKILSSVMGLVLLLVLTRTLAKEDLGRFVLLFGVYEVLEQLALVGIPASLLFVIPTRAREGWRTIVTTAGAMVTAVGAALGGLIFLCAPLVTSLLDGDPSLTTLIQLLGAYAFLALPGALVPTHLLATGRPGWSLGWTLVSDAIRFGSVAVPASLGLPLVTIMTWFVAAGAVRIGGFWVLAWSLDRVAPFRFESPIARELVRHGAPLAAAGGVGKVNQWLDKYVVGFLMPMNAVGVFAVCSREVPIVNNVPYGATTGLIPALSRCHAAGDFDGFVQRWRQLMSKTALVMFPVFGFLFVAAPEIIELLYTQSYQSGVDVFRVYLCLIPMRLCMYGGVLRALDETTSIFRISILSMVTNLVLNIPLYHLFGWVGPALASVLAQLVAAGGMVRVASQRLQVSPLAVFPGSRLFRTACAVLLASTLLFGVLGMDASSGARLGMGAGVFALSFLVSGAALRIVGKEDLAYLRSLIRMP